MEENKKDTAPQEEPRKELPQEEQEHYEPRPAWQLWMARIGLLIFILFVIWQVFQIYTGFQYGGL